MLESIQTTLLAVGVAVSLIVLNPRQDQKVEEKTPINPPAAQVEKQQPLTKEDERQIQCLADNIYYEARGQSKRGQIAVTNVVLNRVNDKRFPKDPCSVIKQKRGKVCQFSWVCKRPGGAKDVNAYRLAKNIAKDMYLNDIRDITRGSIYFHSAYINPGWKYKRMIRIDDHIFYKG